MSQEELRDNLQSQINNVSSQLGVVARVLTNQATLMPAPGLMTAPPGDRVLAAPRDRGGNVSVPRSTAMLLNEALLRAAESSKQMRMALENFEKSARLNEALIERAQQSLSILLSE